ncbi:MAG: hypothetical protein V1494_01945 [Candidatus Diapherotrites archaeon]
MFGKKKEKSPKETFFRFCPRCGSAKVSLTTDWKASLREFSDVCAECGFEAKQFPEGLPEFIAEYQKKLKQEKGAGQNE